MVRAFPRLVPRSWNQRAGGGRQQRCDRCPSLRRRVAPDALANGDLGAMPIEEALTKLQQEVTDRRIRQVSEKKFQQFDEGGEAANEY